MTESSKEVIRGLLLSDISTADLLKELERREGVESAKIPLEGKVTMTFEGCATVLKIVN